MKHATYKDLEGWDPFPKNGLRKGDIRAYMNGSGEIECISIGKIGKSVFIEGPMTLLKWKNALKEYGYKL